MNRSESKYFRTALCMDEALIALLKTRDLEYITVKEICEKAGVNRSTFYLHYETVADLVSETEDMINQRFLSYFTQEEETFVRGIEDRELKDLVLITREYLLPYLRFVEENRNIYRAAFRNPAEARVKKRYSYVKQYIIEPILKRFGVPQGLWGYYTVYYVEGTMAIVKEWLCSDCRDPIETIASVIEECVRPPAAAEGNPYGEESGVRHKGDS